MAWKIGIDGGGTKTEAILIDPSGAVAVSHAAAGCSPSVAGREAAARTVMEALAAVRPAHEPVARTLLCVAGDRAFWKDFAERLKGYGRVEYVDDSVPVLELATAGAPGLVFHSGTGSFVAARAPDGALRYAGGLGWRLGDEGSATDIGRRAAARGLLELQGWSEPSGLGPLIRAHAGPTAAAATAFFYREGRSPTALGALAPEIIRLASGGDPAAAQVIEESVRGLVTLGSSVAAQLFPGHSPGSFPVGASGAILTDPFVFALVERLAAFPVGRITGRPIEGVRLLLRR